MAQKRLTSRKRVAETNLSKIPNQSGIYVLRRKSRSLYVGSAGAGRLQRGIRDQISAKRGITSF